MGSVDVNLNPIARRPSQSDHVVFGVNGQLYGIRAELLQGKGPHEPLLWVFGGQYLD